MKNKNLCVFLLILLIFNSFSVFGSYDVFQPYFGVNESESFNHYNDNDNFYYQLTINTTKYNLTEGADSYYVYITCTENQDLNYSVHGINSTSEYLQTSGVFKCRTPFYYDIYLYKENESSSLDILSKKNYCDEFSYILMKPYSTSSTEKISSGINSFMKYIPFYNAVPKLAEVKYDDVVFWNLYNDCHATIKLYETGNYSLYSVYSKIKPQYTEFVDVRGDYLTYISDVTGLYPIQVTNNSDRTILIHASLWELSNERFIMGYLHIGLIIGLIILIPIVLIFGVKRLFR